MVADAVETDLIKSIQDVNLDDYPTLSNYSKPGDYGLWILWIAKDGAGTKRLSIAQIVTLLVEVFEVSVDETSIVRSFNRLGAKIHKHSENGSHKFEIMSIGIDYLKSNEKSDVRLYLFLPGTNFTSRNVLANDILSEFDGNIKVVDPYCGDETLDLLSSYENGNIMFLTSLSCLHNKKKEEKIKRSILRLKKQFKHVAVKDYQEYDIHDRYILSESKMVLLGQSIKNIGNKESYAVMFDKGFSSDIIQSVATTFDRRWKQAIIIN